MVPLHEYTPGDYGRRPIRIAGDLFLAWWVRTPNGLLGRLSAPEDVAAGRATAHHVVREHQDGTISVNPQPTGNAPNSILVHGGGAEWHGYIDRGVWRSV